MPEFVAQFLLGPDVLAKVPDARELVGEQRADFEDRPEGLMVTFYAAQREQVTDAVDEYLRVLAEALRA